MYFVELFSFYFSWHYSRALAGMFVVWSNFLWFIYNFFSIPLLIKTWISPWKRMQERYRGGLDLNNLFETVIVNVLMRIVGFFMRTIVIGMGLIFLLALIAFGAVFFILWLFFPMLIVFLALLGLAKIF